MIICSLITFIVYIMSITKDSCAAKANLSACGNIFYYIFYLLVKTDSPNSSRANLKFDKMPNVV